jgi:hypothetical protein
MSLLRGGLLTYPGSDNKAVQYSLSYHPGIILTYERGCCMTFVSFLRFEKGKKGHAVNFSI